MVENVRGDVSLHHAPVGIGCDRSHGDGGLIVWKPGGSVEEGCAVHCAERLGQPLGVARGRGRRLELAARVESEGAGGGVAAGAGVVVEAVLVGAAVVVDDRRAQMETVAERRSADAARHGVNRFDAGAAPVRQAGSLAVLAQLVHQRRINPPCLIGGLSRIRILDARAGLLDHVSHAGARPWPHAEEDIVHIAQRVEPQHGRVNPTVHGNIGRTQRAGCADRGHAAALAPQCGRRGRLGRSRLFGRDWTGRQKKNSRQQSCALEDSSHRPAFTQFHTHHSITHSPG